MTASKERRLIALLFGLCLGLAGALAAVLVLMSRRPESGSSESADEVREAAAQKLIERSSGSWDAFLDADVGRVLMSNLDGRVFRGKQVWSNNLGMRERPYVLPKPEQKVRVVLLGDSYVFGYGVEQQERLGVHLEEYLRAGVSKQRGRIEVLHLAASSWNLQSECAYVRRQLGDLRPDLVILITFKNDLADLNGVRGFGELARHSPQVRWRGDSVMNPFSSLTLEDKKSVPHYLLDGLDWESRTRYARAAGWVQDLAGALDRYGTPFLFMIHWHDYNALATELLAKGLRPEQVSYVPDGFANDPATWNDEVDHHWNPPSHERMAKVLYGLIVERGLLPVLDLEPWPEGAQALAEFEEMTRAELARPLERDLDALRSFVRLPPVDFEMVRQVYMGYGADGLVSPYSSVVLARRGGAELVLEGAALDRPELEGGRATVLVEEFDVGRFPLGARDGAAAFPISFALPKEVADRSFVTVRIECDEWVYTRVGTGEAASFRLEEIRIR